MSTEKIVAFVRDVFQTVHEKRRRTLAVLVGALITVGRVGVAAIGRGITSRTSFKHKIKQVDRFLSNSGICVHDWCREIAITVAGNRPKLMIAVDWTKIERWPMLVASVVMRRRGTPIYWATCDWRHLARSQNAFEETFLSMLRTMIPKDVEVTLLFDRGFRRVSLIRHLKTLGFHFVVRCCSDTHVHGEAWHGALSDMPLVRGKIHDLGWVKATIDKPEAIRLVALFDHNQKDAWYLFTDLDLPSQDIIKAYGRRFTIEEVFRDSKNTRYGWSLKEFSVKNNPERLDRMLLIIATAYLLVTLIGLAIQVRGLDRGFRANTAKGQTHSLFQLGWKGHKLVRWLLASWWRTFYDFQFDLAALSCSPNAAHPLINQGGAS